MLEARASGSWKTLVDRSITSSKIRARGSGYPPTLATDLDVHGIGGLWMTRLEGWADRGNLESITLKF